MEHNYVHTTKGRKLADELSKQLPGADIGILSALARHAATYTRIQEARCNVAMSERETKRVERKEAQLEARITELAKALGCGTKFGGDPRGYTVRLILPSGRGNTWGGDEEGWGIG